MSLKTTFKRKKLKIYLHIPFCDSKCDYCAFVSFENQNEKKELYIKAVEKQLKNDLCEFDIKANSITSVYIGGGTPTCLKAHFYENFFAILEPYLTKDAEISTELNPESTDELWLKTMQKYGVNRLSFGVQSFFSDKLELLGRTHSKNNAIKAINLAKNLDFKNISLDLMYSTKLDNKKRIEQEIQNATALPINHLSAYSLTLEAKTKLEKNTEILEDSVKNAEFLFKMLENYGFKQYEISNFGQICKHNLSYWQHNDYLGIGCSAVGYINESRYYPFKNLELYIKNPLHKDIEKLNKNEILNEKVFLGLRSIVGVNESLLDKNMQNNAQILAKAKMLELKNGVFYNKNFLLADELSLFLL